MDVGTGKIEVSDNGAAAENGEQAMIAVTGGNARVDGQTADGIAPAIKGALKDSGTFLCTDGIPAVDAGQIDACPEGDILARIGISAIDRRREGCQLGGSHDLVGIGSGTGTGERGCGLRERLLDSAEDGTGALGRAGDNVDTGGAVGIPDAVKQTGLLDHGPESGCLGAAVGLQVGNNDRFILLRKGERHRNKRVVMAGCRGDVGSGLIGVVHGHGKGGCGEQREHHDHGQEYGKQSFLHVE